MRWTRERSLYSSVVPFPWPLITRESENYFIGNNASVVTSYHNEFFLIYAAFAFFDSFSRVFFNLNRVAFFASLFNNFFFNFLWIKKASRAFFFLFIFYCTYTKRFKLIFFLIFFLCFQKLLNEDHAVKGSLYYHQDFTC